MTQQINSAVEAAIAARDVIIEAAFRKEFGNPDDMTDTQKAEAASQIKLSGHIKDGITHLTVSRQLSGELHLLVEIVQTLDGDTLNTSFRSEIGDLGLEGLV